jgi:hypothetical protein
MFARRQLEHGDRLSQRTLRVRQTTQLRDCKAVGLADDDPLSETGELALFSGADAEPSIETLSTVIC